MTELQHEQYLDALDKYHNDIDCYNLVTCYCRLYQYSDNTFHGELDGHEISVNTKFNEIYVDYEKLFPEEFLEMFEYERDPYLAIYRISGRNYDDYMAHLPFIDKKLNLPKIIQKRPVFLYSSFSNHSQKGGQIRIWENQKKWIGYMSLLPAIH